VGVGSFKGGDKGKEKPRRIMNPTIIATIVGTIATILALVSAAIFSHGFRLLSGSAEEYDKAGSTVGRAQEKKAEEFRERWIELQKITPGVTSVYIIAPLLSSLLGIMEAPENVRENLKRVTRKFSMDCMVTGIVLLVGFLPIVILIPIILQIENVSLVYVFVIYSVVCTSMLILSLIRAYFGLKQRIWCEDELSKLKNEFPENM